MKDIAAWPRTAASYIFFVFSLIVRIPAMLSMRRKIQNSPVNTHADAVHRVSSGWAKGLAKVTGARLHVKGLENVPKEGAVLFVSNHQSDFDIVVYLTCSPRSIGFVAKIEMLKVPLLRTWMKYMRCVFMDRKDMRQSAKTILDGIDVLKSGHSMVLFPEGTRSKSDDMLPFKPGSFKLATKSKAIVVPATVSGSYKIIEGNHYKIKPADVYVTFHPPIYTASLSPDELTALPQTVEDQIRAGLR